MSVDRDAKTRERIAAAAAECFERYGAHRTSMDDVAQAAGLSRQTVYRVFESRSALLEYILGRRIEMMGDKLKPYFETVKDLEEALVEGSILSLRSGVGDPMLHEIVEHSGDHRVEQFLLRGSNEIRKLMLNLWSRVLNEARAAKRLRPGVSNDLAVEWIQNQHALVTIRGDYDDSKMRKMFKTFLVPSLIRAAKGGKRGQHRTVGRRRV